MGGRERYAIRLRDADLLHAAGDALNIAICEMGLPAAIRGRAGIVFLDQSKDVFTVDFDAPCFELCQIGSHEKFQSAPQGGRQRPVQVYVLKVIQNHSKSSQSRQNSTETGNPPRGHRVGSACVLFSFVANRAQATTIREMPCGIRVQTQEATLRTRSNNQRDAAPPQESPTRVRLQRFLADAGVASRRHAEEMVLDGRITINDRVVDSLPAFVNPDVDRVYADGQRVRPQRLTYMLMHKPRNVVCTSRDPEGRRRAIDLLPPMKERLFPVGRLDVDSTGALLLTNDGELAQQLTHPSYAVPKVYRAEVDGLVEPATIEQLRKGIYLAEGKASVSEVSIIHAARDRSVLEITLREGRNRQVRRMFARLDHKVRRLKRIMIGPISIKGLPAGACRHLSPRELEELRAAIEAARSTAAPPPRRKKRRVRKSAAPAGAGPRTAARSTPVMDRADAVGGRRRGGSREASDRSAANKTRKRRVIT